MSKLRWRWLALENCQIYCGASPYIIAHGPGEGLQMVRKSDIPRMRPD
jgi:hypothetical protein